MLEKEKVDVIVAARIASRGVGEGELPLLPTPYVRPRNVTACITKHSQFFSLGSRPKPSSSSKKYSRFSTKTFSKSPLSFQKSPLEASRSVVTKSLPLGIVQYRGLPLELRVSLPHHSGFEALKASPIHVTTLRLPLNQKPTPEKSCLLSKETTHQTWLNDWV